MSYNDRNDFDRDIDGTAKWAMSARTPAYMLYSGPFCEPPPPTCVDCDEDIEVDRYDDPMPARCQRCEDEGEATID